MPDVARFEDLNPEFEDRYKRIVWAIVTTIDSKGRPRSRLLHPIWEGSTGWIATGRNSHKARHIADNPYISVSYWDQQHEQIYAECKAEWDDSPEAKQHLWDILKEAPPPLGYDPAMFWPGGPGSSDFGALRLTPWRLEVSSIQTMMTGAGPQVWRQEA